MKILVNKEPIYQWPPMKHRPLAKLYFRLDGDRISFVDAQGAPVILDKASTVWVEQTYQLSIKKKKPTRIAAWKKRG